MAKIENQAQYEWAVKRVEELLPLVTDETPATDANSIELEFCSQTWLRTIPKSISASALLRLQRC